MTTIANITGPWPDPGPNATRLARRCWELTRVPMASLTAEDLRLLLLQQIEPPALLPFAVSMLLDDPLVEGDLYPGDLLHGVLQLRPEHWAGNEALLSDLRQRLQMMGIETSDYGAP